MQSQQRIEQRQRLIKLLEASNYSHESTTYIVNTYFSKGVDISWDTLTKKLIKESKKG